MAGVLDARGDADAQAAADSPGHVRISGRREPTSPGDPQRSSGSEVLIGDRPWSYGRHGPTSSFSDLRGARGHTPAAVDPKPVTSRTDRTDVLGGKRRIDFPFGRTQGNPRTSRSAPGQRTPGTGGPCGSRRTGVARSRPGRGTGTPSSRRHVRPGRAGWRRAGVPPRVRARGRVASQDGGPANGRGTVARSSVGAFAGPRRSGRAASTPYR